MDAIDVQPAHPGAAEDFCHVMACWATGRPSTDAVSTARPVGCTVSAVTSLSVAPPLLLISLTHTSRTLAAIRAQGRFGLCVLPADREDLCLRFAEPGLTNRFVGCDHDWVLGVPLLDDVVSSTVCAVEREVVVADHVLIVAEPIWWRRRSDRHPLVRFRRDYWTVAPH